MNAQAILVLSIVLAAGCKGSSSSTTDEQGSAAPAGATAAPTTAAGQPGAPGAAGRQPGAQPAGAQPASGSSASASVANQDKSVDAKTGPNGSSLDLQNDAGKGSVSTSSSGVTVKGKSGTAVTIPTGVPGLPHK